MEILRESSAMRNFVAAERRAGRTIGFVPTMGALHEGHLSLVDLARNHTDTVVMSIYVNPIQFGPTEDFAKYPRPFARDCELARERGCAVVFAPSDADMYAPNHSTFVEVEKVTSELCGAKRPGHFRGVATVVLKLFNIVQPDLAVFGQKDAQQVIVIRRMVQDLNIPVRIAVAPTVREPDGLAMSSRNVYLTANERAEAPMLYAGLSALKQRFECGERSTAALKEAARTVFSRAQLLAVEYLEIVDTVTVMPLSTVTGVALAALACRTTQSRTRLIDNVLLGGVF